MARSRIEWTKTTWNPVTGCDKISPGCKNCYAERMADRLQAMGHANYVNGFNVTLHSDLLAMPFGLKKPQMIFVNSMSDLFHESVPDEFIFRVFDTMERADWHTYQVLTKRSNRMRELSSARWQKPHIWLGVSVENESYIYRIKHLKCTDALIKFVSLEPLLGPVDPYYLRGMNWVIVGGESGPGARPMREEWVLSIRDSCHASGIPFFFKQWGGTNKKKTGRLLQERTWDEMPG